MNFQKEYHEILFRFTYQEIGIRNMTVTFQLAVSALIATQLDIRNGLTSTNSK